jgi:uncharacterized membrane protein YdbT with pleckstrin-like domain
MSFAKEQLLPGEELILVAHPHILVLSRSILLTFLSGIVISGLAYTLQIFWLLLFLLAPALYLFWEWLVRMRSEFVVTDLRVVKQEGVFAKTCFDASLDKINNVFHEQDLLGRMFGYGHVGLETASEQGVTLFRFIPDPVQFKNCILDRRERRTAAVIGAKSPRSREEIPQLLEKLATLRDKNIITAAEFEAKKKRLLDEL